MCFNLSSSELCQCIPDLCVQPGRTQLRAVPGTGLQDLGLVLVSLGGPASCHPTWVSLAETKCPAQLAAAPGGRQGSGQPVFLSPILNHKRKGF